MIYFDFNFIFLSKFKLVFGEIYLFIYYISFFYQNLMVFDGISILHFYHDYLERN